MSHGLRSAILLTLFASLAASLGCGPQGPMGIVPGGPLAGDVISEPVSDWRFTDDDVTVAIETRGDWIHHSVTVLAVADDGALYVPSREGFRKTWVKNVQGDARVRVGVDGKIYPGLAKRVTDPAEAASVARAILRKYLGLEAANAVFLLDPPDATDDRVDAWLFRIESPELAR